MIRREVAGVTATVPPIEIRHVPVGPGLPNEHDMTVTLPEAVLARCPVLFHFGRRRRTKIIRSVYRWTNPLGWPRSTPATATEVTLRKQWAAERIAVQICQHGIAPGDFAVVEVDVAGRITARWNVTVTADDLALAP